MSRHFKVKNRTFCLQFSKWVLSFAVGLGKCQCVTKLNTGCFQVNGENTVLQGSFSWPSIPFRKTGILMIKTCGVINRNHYYYSDTGGITGIFSDNCYHCFLVPSSLTYLTFIRNIKSAPIIPSPSHPLPPLPPLTLRHREH